MELTVGFERKVQPGDKVYDFEHEVGSVYLKGSISDELGDDTTQALADLAANLFAVAKIRVLTELGLEFVSDENGIVREVERVAAQTVQALPGTTVVQAVQPITSAAQYQQAAPVQPAVQPIAVAPQPAPVQAIAPPPQGVAPVAVAPPTGDPSKEALIQLYLQNPNDWYDNRSKATPKQPIFRHKTLKLSTGYNAGIWRTDMEAAGYQV